MARIQVLELPSKVVGEVVDVPFVIVIDQADQEPTGFEGLKDQVGAVAVLYTSMTIDIPTNQ